MLGNPGWQSGNNPGNPGNPGRPAGNPGNLAIIWQSQATQLKLLIYGSVAIYIIEIMG